MSDNYLEEIFDEMKTLPPEGQRAIARKFGWKSKSESLKALEKMGEKESQEFDDWLGHDEKGEIRKVSEEDKHPVISVRGLLLPLMGVAVVVLLGSSAWLWQERQGLVKKLERSEIRNEDLLTDKNNLKKLVGHLKEKAGMQHVVFDEEKE